MLFATSCPVCRAQGPAPCVACIGALERPPPLAAPAGLDTVVALFAYEGAGRVLASSVKYGHGRAALPWLGAALAGALRDDDRTAAATLTWVPTTRGRRAERGFDHARLLARATARALRRPARGLLVRRDRQPQTGRTARERASGPALAMAGRAPAVVVIVDDVVTTGASMAAAAAALRAAGAEIVIGAALARTPRKGAAAPF